MKKAVSEIKVGKRHRANVGNLDGLSASMSEVGLLQAIGIDKSDKLVFGGRRLAAAKHLGWKEIECRIIDLDNPLLAERDENFWREDFTPSERVSIAQAIEDAEKEKAKERQKAGGKEVGNPTGPGKVTPEVGEEEGRASTKAASAVGMSRKTYEKAKEVVTKGTAEDVAEMDATGKVSGVHKKMKDRAEQHEGNGKSEEKAKSPRAGKVIFDDRPFDETYGKLIRFFDRRKEAYGHGVKSTVKEHADCVNAMGLVLSAWKRWQKATT